MSAAGWQRRCCWNMVGQACTGLGRCTQQDTHPHLGMSGRSARAAAALLGCLHQAAISSQLQDPPALAPGHAACLT